MTERERDQIERQEEARKTEEHHEALQQKAALLFTRIWYELDTGGEFKTDDFHALEDVLNKLGVRTEPRGPQPSQK